MIHSFFVNFRLYFVINLNRFKEFVNVDLLNDDDVL